MRFVHTFWTPPKFSGDIHIHRVIECDTLYYALSFAYLKNLGQEVVLHTDDKGADILSFIPYDKVYLTLNDIPEDANHNMWACGKFFAMKNEPLDSIHIDGDVFIKTEKCLNEIIQQYHNNDIVVQDIEVNVYYGDYSYLTNAGIDLPITIINKGRNACCTGLIGFNNQHLKDEYFNAYFKLFNDIRTNDVLSHMNRGFTMDLFCEQYLLKCICDNGGYKIGVLVNNYLTRYDEFKYYGFEHLMGIKKYKTSAKLDKYKTTLCVLSQTLFLNFIKKYPNYFN